MGFLKVFEDDENLKLKGFVYCPNYEKVCREGLFDIRYKNLIEKFPIYTKKDILEFSSKLKGEIERGMGESIFDQFIQSSISISKKVLENATKIIQNESKFTLIGNQIVAKNMIIDKVSKSNLEKSVIIIKGGPGTGKTLIGLHLLAKFAKDGKSIFFASKSKSLIEGIKFNLPKGNTSKILFTNLNSFIPSRIKENDNDILLVDESHRIGEKSNYQFTKLNDKTDMPVVEQLIRSSKVSIFFIDDKQVIRSQEIGSTNLIEDTAKKLNCKIEKVELFSQFRCSGSNNYLNWIESILGHLDKKIIFDQKNDNFDFRIIDSPKKLYEIIQGKNFEKGKNARLCAGFCWKWSKQLDEKGEFVKDVKIGDFEMSWETHRENFSKLNILKKIRNLI